MLENYDSINYLQGCNMALQAELLQGLPLIHILDADSLEMPED